eukprot:g6297.t1
MSSKEILLSQITELTSEATDAKDLVTKKVKARVDEAISHFHRYVSSSVDARADVTSKTVEFVGATNECLSAAREKFCCPIFDVSSITRLFDIAQTMITRHLSQMSENTKSKSRKSNDKKKIEKAEKKLTTAICLLMEEILLHLCIQRNEMLEKGNTENADQILLSIHAYYKGVIALAKQCSSPGTLTLMNGVFKVAEIICKHFGASAEISGDFIELGSVYREVKSFRLSFDNDSVCQFCEVTLKLALVALDKLENDVGSSENMAKKKVKRAKTWQKILSFLLARLNRFVNLRCTVYKTKLLSFHDIDTSSKKNMKITIPVGKILSLLEKVSGFAYEVASGKTLLNSNNSDVLSKRVPTITFSLCNLPKSCLPSYSKEQPWSLLLGKEHHGNKPQNRLWSLLSFIDAWPFLEYKETVNALPKLCTSLCLTLSDLSFKEMSFGFDFVVRNIAKAITRSHQHVQCKEEAVELELLLWDWIGQSENIFRCEFSASVFCSVASRCSTQRRSQLANILLSIVQSSVNRSVTIECARLLGRILCIMDKTNAIEFIQLIKRNRMHHLRGVNSGLPFDYDLLLAACLPFGDLASSVTKEFGNILVVACAQVCSTQLGIPDLGEKSDVSSSSYRNAANRRVRCQSWRLEWALRGIANICCGCGNGTTFGIFPSNPTISEHSQLKRNANGRYPMSHLNGKCDCCSNGLFTLGTIEESVKVEVKHVLRGSLPCNLLWNIPAATSAAIRLVGWLKPTFSLTQLSEIVQCVHMQWKHDPNRNTVHAAYFLATMFDVDFNLQPNVKSDVVLFFRELLGYTLDRTKSQRSKGNLIWTAEAEVLFSFKAFAENLTSNLDPKDFLPESATEKIVAYIEKCEACNSGNIKIDTENIITQSTWKSTWGHGKGKLCKSKKEGVDETVPTPLRKKMKSDHNNDVNTALISELQGVLFRVKQTLQRSDQKDTQWFRSEIRKLSKEMQGWHN